MDPNEALKEIRKLIEISEKKSLNLYTVEGTLLTELIDKV